MTFYQPSKLKFLLGCHLATNSFSLGRLFTSQVASSKILGAMVTNMVATWRVVYKGGCSSLEVGSLPQVVTHGVKFLVNV